MHLAWKAVGMLGVMKHATGNRQRPNADVRRLLGFSNVRHELRRRRLGWLGDMLMHQRDNVQRRAAIGGAMEAGGMRIQGEYTPWLQQLKADVEWFVMREHAFRTQELEGKIRDGMARMVVWHEQGTLAHILKRDEMG